MVAIVAAVPSLWLKERIVDPEGFATTAAQMSEDQQVKDYLVEQITANVVEVSGVSATSVIVEPMARSYVDSDQYRADFVDVLTQQHDWLFSEPGPGTDPTVMNLDITDMVNRVISQLGVPIVIDRPILIPLADGGNGLEAGRYHQTGSDITRLAYVSTGVAVVAGLLALVIARRRSTVFAWLGVGTVLAAAATWLITRFFAERARQEIETVDSGARSVADAIIDAAVTDLGQLALITGAVGLAVVVVGGLARLVAGRSAA